MANGIITSVLKDENEHTYRIDHFDGTFEEVEEEEAKACVGYYQEYVKGELDTYLDTEQYDAEVDIIGLKRELDAMTKQCMWTAGRPPKETPPEKASRSSSKAKKEKEEKGGKKEIVVETTHLWPTQCLRERWINYVVNAKTTSSMAVAFKLFSDQCINFGLIEDEE